MKTRGSGGPEQVLAAAEMRQLEQAAFDSGRVSSRAAMERAGQGVAAEILALRPEPGRALILCGPGNNGGDGYVIARLLHGNGWDVTVAALGRREAAGADAAANRALWEALGPVGELLEMPLPEAPDAVVDALFGIGLGRGIGGALAGRFEAVSALARASGALRVAVDLPSWLDADSGRAEGAVLPADLTVTFHCRKPAHQLRADLCGTVKVVDIGL